AFRLPHLADERRAHHVRARGHRNADLETGVGLDLHILLPRVIPGKARLSVAGITGSRRAALGFPTHREALGQRAVDADIEPLRPAHAHHVVLILAAQSNLDRVLAIGRELIADRDAAA